MRCTKYMFLLLLFGLPVLLAGCDFRDILDEYPVSGVKIKFNWKGVADKLPEGMTEQMTEKTVENMEELPDEVLQEQLATDSLEAAEMVQTDTIKRYVPIDIRV